MREYIRPTMQGEMFAANEYVTVCWGVECNILEANGYEQSVGNTKGITHESNHCGLFNNQVIKDYNSDGVADAMIETGTDGLGDLVCIIYSDGEYEVPKNIESVKLGDYIYWTTSASDGRTWHHQGFVKSVLEDHPNRS